MRDPTGSISSSSRDSGPSGAHLPSPPTHHPTPTHLNTPDQKPTQVGVLRPGAQRQHRRRRAPRAGALRRGDGPRRLLLPPAQVRTLRDLWLVGWFAVMRMPRGYPSTTTQTTLNPTTKSPTKTQGRPRIGEQAAGRRRPRGGLARLARPSPRRGTFWCIVLCRIWMHGMHTSTCGRTRVDIDTFSRSHQSPQTKSQHPHQHQQDYVGGSSPASSLASGGGGGSSGAPPPKPKRGSGRGASSSSPQPGDYGYNDAARALVSLSCGRRGKGVSFVVCVRNAQRRRVG